MCGCGVVLAAGFALNAAAAFERQLNTMFFPLVSLATIVHYQPSYPLFNKTFDTVAKQLMEQVCACVCAVYLCALCSCVGLCVVRSRQPLSALEPLREPSSGVCVYVCFRHHVMCVCAAVVQMPTGITTLIAAPQGVLRNFYPNDNYCQDHCDNVHINLLKGRCMRVPSVYGVYIVFVCGVCYCAHRSFQPGGSSVPAMP